MSPLTNWQWCETRVDSQHIASEKVADCDPVVCRCLRVREQAILEAIESRELTTVREVRCTTGAGGGCNACHATLRRYLRAAADRVPVG